MDSKREKMAAIYADVRNQNKLTVLNNQFVECTVNMALRKDRMVVTFVNAIIPMKKDIRNVCN